MFSFLLFSTLFVVCVARSGVLYGMDEKSRLIEIDVSTGEQTVKSAPIVGAETQQLADIDQKNNIYYTILFNLTTKASVLTGWELNTFKRLPNTVKLPFQQAAFVGLGQHVKVNQLTGEVVCTGMNGHETNSYLVDPKSGSVKELSGVSLQLLLGAFSALRSASQPYLWTSFFNPTTRAVVAARFDADKKESPLVKPNTYIIEAGAYSMKQDKIYGMGIQVVNHTFSRPLIQMDPVTGEQTILSHAKGFEIIQASEATFAEDTNVLYTVMNKQLKSEEFYLVGINVKTYAVTSVKLFDETHGLAVWSLNYKN